MGQEFNDAERNILLPYFTNVDKPIYAFTGKVPEEVVAVLFSKYSRSKESLRRNFLKLVKDPESGFSDVLSAGAGTGDVAEFKAALTKARRFFQRILVGYGDDSVGELGIAHVACEDVSNIASKRLEDARLTSPLEKSTRYVVYDKDKYLREQVLMNSKFALEYVRVNELLLNTYSLQMDPMKEFVRKQLPIEHFDLLGRKLSEITDSSELKRAKIAYEAAVRAKACDVLRYYLPASTLTNLGITANGRAFEYLISKLMSDELIEVRNIGKAMHEELSKVIPSLVKRAKPSEYLIKTRDNMKELHGEIFSCRAEPADDVVLIEYDKQASEKLVTAALYGYGGLSMKQIKNKVLEMCETDRDRVVEQYIGGRTNRREKPLRAAETIYYTFDILSDYGAYRDLQRHRMLTQIAQPLTVHNGYDIPQELKEIGFSSKFVECMEEAFKLYNKIYLEYPNEAQYIVPFAYKIRYFFTLNLRELFHLVELRSMPQGHLSYRYVAQEMYKQFQKIHPKLASYMRFVYLDENNSLGRLKGELNTQEKLANMEKK